MNTQKSLLMLLLLLTLTLAACSQAGERAENISDNSIVSDATVDKNGGEDDSMMKDAEESTMTKDEEHMSENTGSMEDEMIDDHDEAMVENEIEKVDDHNEAMMGDENEGDENEGMDDQNDDMMDDKEDKSMKEGGDDMSDGSMLMIPEWFKITLTAVGSDETFTIKDFKGKVVLVETLAMWCSNCLKQQGQVKLLHNQLDERDDFVSLGIDIDPNENADALLSYINKHEFNWVYTVAPVEVSREIGQLYGDQFLNPPSTPMLIIDKDGEVHPLPFGIKSAEELLDALKPFMDGEM